MRTKLENIPGMPRESAMFTLPIPAPLADLIPFAEGLARDPESEALAAFARDYVHRAGYRLGVNGEWIPVETQALSAPR
jgi:hypothetical protein